MNYRDWIFKSDVSCRLNLIPALGTLIVLTACVSPAKNFDQQADYIGLRKEIIAGNPFIHAAYLTQGFAHKPFGDLHVYLGGDGTPMIAGLPSKDPTPRNRLMLRLLALDLDPAVYVGRPCYHGLTRTQGCSKNIWTSARYSEAVVSSMAVVVRTIMTTHGYDQVSWYGHSGGGTLAILLAERFPETRAIVTIAANLDIHAWAEHHGYANLVESISPVSRLPLAPRIVQRYYVGANDRIVTPELIQNALMQAGNRVNIVVGYNHICCWEDIWPDILANVAKLLSDKS